MKSVIGNSINFHVIIDSYNGHYATGRLQNQDEQDEWYSFQSIGSITRLIETILDKKKLMRSTFDLRSFSKGEKNNSIEKLGVKVEPYSSENDTFTTYSCGKDMYKDMETNNKKTSSTSKSSGDVATFLVKVKHRQNGTFQGSLHWMDENRLINFRSDFEMLKLIYDALNKTSVDEIVSWDD